LTAPIALVTGYAELSEADIAAAQLAGLLRKPFTIRELQGLLTQLRAVADGDLETTEYEAGLIHS
jgi:CheY-like chemotaxis protein